MPLEIVRNDIVRMEVDAIVNAANSSLLGGGGVDGAIHRAAGPELLEECRQLGGCKVGEAKLTRGYNLPCRYVIHTVGPVWRGGGHGERERLCACYESSLALAEAQGCESVAFPLISTGAYGYPKDLALQAAVETITRFLLHSDMTVYIVAFSRESVAVSERLLGEVTAYIDDVYAEAHEDRSRRFREEEFDAFNMPAPRSAPPAAAPRPGLLSGLRRPRPARTASAPAEREEPIGAKPSLEDMLGRLEESFAAMLLRKIDERRMTDAECYKRANIDRRLFNKIKNNPAYRPGKQTALAFAIALRLSLDETRDLLMKAGFALSHSSKADIVVEYFILNGQYDIFELNEVLFRLDLPPLGC